MTTRTRALLLVVAVAVLALVALMGRGAYIVLHNLSVTRSTARLAAAQFDELRRPFPERPPLIQIDDPRHARVHVNHPLRSAPLAALEGFEILVWQADEEKIVHTRAPLWMMRFSALSVMSELGIAPGSVQVTVDDVQRYGPGVIVDYTSPKGDRALVVVR